MKELFPLVKWEGGGGGGLSFRNFWEKKGGGVRFSPQKGRG